MSREVALEAELIEARAQLRARDEFLAVAAHELRNPMTPIAAWVELLITQARRRPGDIPSEMLRGLERLEYLVEPISGAPRRCSTSPASARVTSS